MPEYRINIMEPQTEPQRPAEDSTQVMYGTITERFVALLIDYGVIFLPFHFIVNLWLKFFRPELELWQALALMGVVNGIFILYETIFSCGDRMTLGKALVGLAVVKKDISGSLSFWQALRRAVGYYVSGALLFGGFLMAFFDDRHRALHDIFGGSVVVQIRQKSVGERVILRVAGGLLLLAFAWMIYAQFFNKGALLDEYYIRHGRMQLQKIALLEEAHYVKFGSYTNNLERLFLMSGDPVQFQRDTLGILEPRGFKIGVSKDSYKIIAVAKDRNHTRIAFSPQR